MKKILMIPGPVEYDSSVYSALSMPSRAHTDVTFINTFRESLEEVSRLFSLEEGFPFIISGSGTLGMEVSVANFLKRNDRVLVVSTGFFGERYLDLLSVYTDNVDVYRPPLGKAADPSEIKERVENNDYSLVTVTHVDTSTGVRNDLKSIAKSFQDSNALLISDGVCSIGGEDFSMDWGVDVSFTASQKALGTPPGLTVGAVGKKAVERLDQIKPLSFFSDLRKWKKVSESMLQSKPGYFGTPNVNLITALRASLENINREGITKRVKRHELVATAFREALGEMGLKTIPDGDYANTLSTPYLPEGVKLPSFLAETERLGAVFAGGLISDIKDRYFRIGHMGSVGQSETMIAIAAIERALRKNGYRLELGSGLARAQEVLDKADFAFNSQ